MKIKSKLIPSLMAVLMIGASPYVLLAETINDAMRWAYQDNPDLNAARAGVRVALENANIANAAGRPQVSVNMNYAQTGAEGAAGSPTGYASGWRVNDSLSATLSMSLLLYDGGKTALAVDSALAATRATNLRLMANEQQILLATVQAYLNVLRDRELVGSANNNIRALSTSVDSARVAYDAGAATITELSQTEAALAQSRAGLAGAQANLKASEAQYKALTGRMPGKLQSVGKLPAYPSSLDAAIAMGDRQSPLIQASIETERAAQYDLRRAEKARMPQVNLSASATRTNPLDGSAYTDSNQIGLGVNVPLYQGGSEDALVRQAQSSLEARAQETISQRALVQQNVANAWAQLQNAQSAVQANQQVVEAQSLADQGAAVEYDFGAITVVDRLETEQNLINARTSLLTAQYQRQFAVYQLLAAMGVLTVEGMNLGIAPIDPLKASTPSAPKSERAKSVEQISDRWKRAE